MSEKLHGRLVAFAAGLLRLGPSPEKEDFPHVPRYYRQQVADNLEFCRKAAICMREGADEIQRLQAEVGRLVRVLDCGVGKDALMAFLAGEERAETAEACLSEIRALPDEWGVNADQADDNSGGATIAANYARAIRLCVAQLRQILDKYDA